MIDKIQMALTDAFLWLACKMVDLIGQDRFAAQLEKQRPESLKKIQAMLGKGAQK